MMKYLWNKLRLKSNYLCLDKLSIGRAHKLFMYEKTVLHFIFSIPFHNSSERDGCARKWCAGKRR